MAAIDFANPLLGAQYLAGSLLLNLGYHVMKRDRFRFMGLLLGAGPALSLLRGVFFYDSIFYFCSSESSSGPLSRGKKSALSGRIPSGVA